MPELVGAPRCEDLPALPRVVRLPVAVGDPPIDAFPRPNCALKRIEWRFSDGTLLKTRLSRSAASGWIGFLSSLSRPAVACRDAVPGEAGKREDTASHRRRVIRRRNVPSQRHQEISDRCASAPGRASIRTRARRQRWRAHIASRKREMTAFTSSGLSRCGQWLVPSIFTARSVGSRFCSEPGSSLSGVISDHFGPL